MGAGRFRFSPRATGITHRRAAPDPGVGVPRTTSGASRSGGMPTIRKEVSSWSGEVLGSTLHTVLGTTDSFSRTSPREPFEGLGLASFPGCGSRVRYDADGPELARVGLGLRRAHGSHHGGTVRPDASSLPTRPKASGFGANVRAGGRGERRRRRRPARLERHRRRHAGGRASRDRALSPRPPNNRTCARGARRARASIRTRRARR